MSWSEDPIPNAAFMDGSVFTGVSDLIEGVAPLDPQTLYNLNAVVEATVLHDVLIHNTVEDPLVQILDERGIGVNRQRVETRYPWDDDVIQIIITKISSVLDEDNFSALLQWKYDRHRERRVGEYLKILTEIMKAPEANKAEFFGHTKFTHIVELLHHFDRLAAKSGYPVYHDVMLTPFRVPRPNTRSLAREIYERVALYFGLKVEQVDRHLGLQIVKVPPLLAVLLNRCKDRSEIPDRLLELRDEYSELRRSATEYDKTLRGKMSLGEMFERLDELEAAWESLQSHLADRRHSKLMYRIWDIVKSGKPLTIATTMLDEVVASLKQRQIRARVDGFSDLWSAAKNIRGYENLLERVFDETLDSKLWTAFDQFSEVSEKRIYPHGRPNDSR